MRRVRIAQLAIAILAVAAAVNPLVGDRIAAADPAPGVPTLTSIGVSDRDGSTTVALTGDAELRYEYFLIEGTSLVIDVEALAGPGVPAEQVIDGPLVSRIRVAPGTGPRPGTRVAIDLSAKTPFMVRGGGATILVSLDAPVSAPAAAGDDTLPEASAPRPRVTAVEVSRVGGFSLLIRATGPLQYLLEEDADPRRISLLLPGADLAPELPARLAAARLGGEITDVTVTPGSPGPRVVVLLAKKSPYRVSATGDGLVLVLSSEGAVRPPLDKISIDPFERERRIVEPSVESFSGRPISLDFVDAPILDIFRLISDFSGRNIVAGDEVTGIRSIRLVDIPWDQALDLILKTHNPQLVQQPEVAGVIRVTTLDRVTKKQTELEDRHNKLLVIENLKKEQALKAADLERKLEKERWAQLEEQEKAARQRSKGWRERTFLVSYGDTQEAAERLKKFFSGCTDGCIFEEGLRTNTIFVRDFVDNIEQMETVFEMLETPAPAVMVEARIVEVLSDFSQSIGVQWGGAYRADPAHGNATGYAFPNSIGVGGAIDQGTDGINPGTYLVNLPASAPVGGIGISLGHIANTASLDVKLSALEKMGKTKILSSPKILVIQNEDAKINVGSQLPVPKTDAEGNRTVDWKDVGILLQVKPQVTNDNKVFMDVSIEKSSRGETVSTTEGEMFSIETRNAVTKVLVGDGETSVIGGIYVETTSGTDSGVPWFQKLPLLGWLFKSKSTFEDRTELMIFLTPRITSHPGQASP